MLGQPPSIIFSKRIHSKFSLCDASEDITRWYESDSDVFSLLRQPVIIEGDVRLIDWKRIATV